MKRQNVFLGVLSDYFSKYTTVTKGLSQNTIRSYTYTFQLLFVFLKETMALTPEKVDFNTFDQNTLESFLAWMEENRGCGINTRNQKLSGLSAFAKYAVNREPVMAAGFYSAVNGIPKKKRIRQFLFTLPKRKSGYYCIRQAEAEGLSLETALYSASFMQQAPGHRNCAIFKSGISTLVIKHP